MALCILRLDGSHAHMAQQTKAAQPHPVNPGKQCSRGGCAVGGGRWRPLLDKCATSSAAGPAQIAGLIRKSSGAMATLSRCPRPQSAPVLKPLGDRELFPGTSPRFPVNGSRRLYKCNVASGGDTRVYLSFTPRAGRTAPEITASPPSSLFGFTDAAKRGGEMPSLCGPYLIF